LNRRAPYGERGGIFSLPGRGAVARCEPGIRCCAAPRQRELPVRSGRCARARARHDVLGLGGPWVTWGLTHQGAAAGGGGRVRVLRKAAAGHHLQRAQLLRRVRQRGRHDERRRDAHVLLPGGRPPPPRCAQPFASIRDAFLNMRALTKQPSSPGSVGRSAGRRPRLRARCTGGAERRARAQILKPAEKKQKFMYAGGAGRP